MRDRICVADKLRELEDERLTRLAAQPAGARPPRPGPAPRGLRAAFASHLARLALALHREAATRTATARRAD